MGQGTDGTPVADLVFEGGGVKGIGLAGAYRQLADHGYQPACVAGTSAGAITAALVAAGYSGEEVQDIVLHQMRFTDFADREFLDRFGAVGEAAQFFKSRGMHSGRFFLHWIQGLLQAKGVTHFGDLRNPDASRPNRAYRLQVIASDLSARTMLVLPRDAPALGVDPDRLEIAQAVRMSMSIPVFFEPVLWPNTETSQEHVIVDGGILSNFPVWLFDARGTVPEFPTFGLRLVAPASKPPAGTTAVAAAEGVSAIGSDAQYVKAIAETMMEAHDRFYIAQADYARTIPIPTLGVKTTQFDISGDQARALFESGRAAAKQFLAGWDFQAYVDKFRTPAAAAPAPPAAG